MPDQADKLRHLIHGTAPVSLQASGGPPMVVVTAGQPGLGVSTTAANLAAVLADWGDRVLLVDAAHQRNNLAEIAGTHRTEGRRTLADVLAGKCAAADAVTQGPGAAMLLSNGITRGSRLDTSRSALQRLLSQLQTLRDDFDLLIVDVGSGLNEWTRRFWLQARSVLLVTSTDSSALLDTYAMIKLSVADGSVPDLRVLVNQCDDGHAAERTQHRISAACQRFLGRVLPPVPSLPLHVPELSMPAAPRVWEAPDTPYGHASMWLARALRDALHLDTGDGDCKTNHSATAFSRFATSR
jgi:flagellar biosynthesis protein FlhG